MEQQIIDQLVAMRDGMSPSATEASDWLTTFRRVNGLVHEELSHFTVTCRNGVKKAYLNGVEVQLPEPVAKPEIVQETATLVEEKEVPATVAPPKKPGRKPKGA